MFVPLGNLGAGVQPFDRTIGHCQRVNRPEIPILSGNGPGKLLKSLVNDRRMIWKYNGGIRLQFVPDT
jgi:hypothetical protein